MSHWVQNVSCRTSSWLDNTWSNSSPSTSTGIRLDASIGHSITESIHLSILQIALVVLGGVFGVIKPWRIGLKHWQLASLAPNCKTKRIKDTCLHIWLRFFLWHWWQPLGFAVTFLLSLASLDQVLLCCRVEISRMWLVGVTCVSPSLLTWAQKPRATIKQERPIAQRRSWAMLHVHNRGQCWCRLELTTHSKGRVSTCCTFWLRVIKAAAELSSPYLMD